MVGILYWSRARASASAALNVISSDSTAQGPAISTRLSPPTTTPPTLTCLFDTFLLHLRHLPYGVFSPVLEWALHGQQQHLIWQSHLRPGVEQLFAQYDNVGGRD